MTLKDIYRKTGEPVIATYQWTDIASGIGYVTFYPCSVRDSGGNDYTLMDRAVYGILEAAQYIQNTSAEFETSPFNYPRVIKGDAILDLDLQNVGGETMTFTFYVVSGGTATQIGTIAENLGAMGSRGNKTLRVPLTETNIKKGDFIRVYVDVGTNSFFWFDNSVTSPSKFYIPFKVEV